MISERAQRIKPFIAMDIIEEAMRLEQQGHDVISFSLGEPDFDAPACVKKAAAEALEKNFTKYTHSQGAIQLREAIAKHYKKTYAVTVDSTRIIVTQGSSPAFFLIFSALLEDGDEVILPNPHYPCDANFVEFLGGKPVFISLDEKKGYQWDLAEVKSKISSKTKGIFVTSPSNPTGTVLKKEILKGLTDFKIPIISDELYHGLIYSGDQHSILEFTENAFVVNGFSKAYAMTGFRLGYVIAPQDYVRALQKVQQNFHIAANTFVQMAGIAALEKAGPDLEKMRTEFQKRRNVMMKGLKELGFKINYQPDGAFYIFVNCEHINSNSYDLAFDILRKVHLAVTPGIDFGLAGEGHLRFAYTVSVEKIHEGLKRLGKYLGK